ncbi:MAG TPA: SDR family oxidoreductase, partial [Rhodothermales bacterium]|nr:SDR family oxidoreductase [Rhodothermales bacterium]
MAAGTVLMIEGRYNIRNTNFVASRLPSDNFSRYEPGTSYMDLQDKVAVVTGASSGIGLEFAKELVDKGAVVFGLARSIDKMEQIRRDLGERFHPVECDVRDEASVNAAFDMVLRDGKRIDILINNAGLGRFDKVVDLSVADWDVQMETNVRGVFLCTKAAVPQMRQQNAASGFGGHIVNIVSIAGLIGNPNLSAYNASKFAARGFTEAIMKELRDDGIKVTA